MGKIKEFIKSLPFCNEIIRRTKIRFISYSKYQLDKQEVDKRIKDMNEVGIEHHSQERILISLTSFPARINDVKYVVYSLLNQTHKPDKIILWLGKEKFPNKDADLPKDLLKMKEYGLSIEYCEDIRSYTKLLPALQNYPDYLIITVDDDIYYPKTLVDKLYHTYIQNKNCIIANRAHGITVKDNSIEPYSKWTMEIKNNASSYRNFFTGVGGVLYNPKLLPQDIFRKDLFMNYCPHADDIWFNAMAVLNGTKTKIVSGDNTPLYVNYAAELSGTNTLGTKNNGLSENDTQLKKVLELYPEIIQRIIQD